MKDVKFIEIKNRIQKKCLEIWGIEDINMADPLVMMLLDVFVHELYYLYQEGVESDNKIIERIAQEIVPSQWNLPMPAHTLASTTATKGIVILNNDTEFVVKSGMVTNVDYDIYFTPFTNENIVEGEISFQMYDSFLIDSSKTVQHLSAQNKVLDHRIWVGLDVSKENLEKLNSLKFTFITENSSLDNFLQFIKVKDSLGNNIEIENETFEEVQDNKHYAENIKSFYKNSIYKVKLNVENLIYESILNRFEIDKEELKTSKKDTGLIWLEFIFPEIFTKTEFDKIQIKINTFPIVNRKLNNRVHNAQIEGRLFPMKAERNTHFLDVMKIFNEKNIEFTNGIKQANSLTSNTFTIFYGGLENYDSRNAKFFLKKLARALREDIGSFSNINADYIDATMTRINEELNSIESKINSSYSQVNEEEVYALIHETDKSKILYYSYWTSNGQVANNLKKGTVLKQTSISELAQDSTIFETSSIGGIYRNNKVEKLINLRYGFLSKERLVTKQDIKSAVHYHLRNITKDVLITDGVGISSNRKQGVYRTIDIKVVLQEKYALQIENKKKIEMFLKETLEKQSVMNIPFQITIN
ncbi:hypothetical protein [Flavobacterium pectinovorum]|uniref:Baseplate protein J-like domain-containing protein n=1 Tax=Flavobacterium pectinovorum TaxID=29533 RepID=A0AB36NYY5_9FLAO|nr:hypothetical protein [Flavobacterium pectinovorum]OXB03286.1 hypothetical protein B0A72_15215 [Flavobacterium pectinovorum]SHL21053.1 hypothetical protein SAMN05444387_0029 [Flavobacterium pectinovorum]